MRDDLEKQRADDRSLWQRFLDAPARWQVALFVALLVVVSFIVTAVRNGEAQANPHDVTICNDLHRLNDIGSSQSPDDPAARAEAFRILDEMVSESVEASREIKQAVSVMAARRGTITDSTEGRAAAAADLQAIVDACNQLRVPSNR